MADSQPFLKRISWQYANCLSCKWFVPSDVFNADILTSGKCLQPELKPFKLVVCGKDWCNRFEDISQEQIDMMQKKAEEEEKKFYSENQA